jgi:hypothetical protein
VGNATGDPLSRIGVKRFTRFGNEDLSFGSRTYEPQPNVSVD